MKESEMSTTDGGYKTDRIDENKIARSHYGFYSSTLNEWTTEVLINMQELSSALKLTKQGRVFCIKYINEWFCTPTRWGRSAGTKIQHANICTYQSHCRVAL